MSIGPKKNNNSIQFYLYSVKTIKLRFTEISAKISVIGHPKPLDIDYLYDWYCPQKNAYQSISNIHPRPYNLPMPA